VTVGKPTKLPIFFIL